MDVCVYTLFSSSSGNCTFVTDGKTAFLIDAGRNMKQIELALSSLSFSLKDISAVFVTHEHTDHISALKCVCKNYKIPVHAARGTAACIEADGVIEHQPVFEETLGDFRITSFKTSHDCACSLGYRIEHKGGAVIGSMTDTGYITRQAAEALRGCDAVILESNYDPDMLKYGPYPYNTKQRISSDVGHLSNEQSSLFLPYLYGTGTRRVLLAHISPENNTPEKAKESAEKIKTAQTLTGLSVECAKRYEVTKLI